MMNMKPKTINVLIWKINVSFCTFAFQLRRQDPWANKGKMMYNHRLVIRICDKLSTCPSRLTAENHLFSTPSAAKVKFGIFLAWRMISIVHFMSEPMKLSVLWGNDDRAESTNHRGNPSPLVVPSPTATIIHTLSECHVELLNEQH